MTGLGRFKHLEDGSTTGTLKDIEKLESFCTEFLIGGGKGVVHE
jgi:hypothetical protein